MAGLLHQDFIYTSVWTQQTGPSLFQKITVSTSNYLQQILVESRIKLYKRCEAKGRRRSRTGRIARKRVAVAVPRVAVIDTSCIQQIRVNNSKYKGRLNIQKVAKTQKKVVYIDIGSSTYPCRNANFRSSSAQQR